MRYLSMALILSAILAACLADRDLDDAFERFKTKHGRKYRPSEEAIRKNSFSRSHRRIQEINSKGLSWTAGHNEMSDWTDEERAALLTPRQPSTGNRTENAKQENNAVLTEDRLASEIDYRGHRCLSPVKYQGQCGSSWAFAAITPLEFAHCIKYNSYQAIPLSEQQLVSCDTINRGCSGGYFADAWYYLKYIGGASTSSNSYPYASGSSGVSGGCIKSGLTTVARASSFSEFPARDVSAMIAQLRNGPIAAGIHFSDDMFYYAGGLYLGSCSDDYRNINHDIVIVGYGTDPASGPGYEQFIPAWVVRNSWGTSWGMSGYMLMPAKMNMCAIESSAGYVTAA